MLDAGYVVYAELSCIQATDGRRTRLPLWRSQVHVTLLHNSIHVHALLTTFCLYHFGPKV